MLRRSGNRLAAAAGGSSGASASGSKLTEPASMKHRSTAAAQPRRFKLNFFRKVEDSTKHVRIGLFTRFRAWYLGVENVEVFSRYGTSSMYRHIFAEWRGALLAAFMLYIINWNHNTNTRADEVLDSFELNRRKFYGRDFSPEVAANEPGNHDGARGYSHVDRAAVNGLKTDIDSQLVGPPRVLLRQITEKLDVTPTMVRDARTLKDAVNQLQQQGGKQGNLGS